MWYRVRVRGRGSVVVAAYGLADAEHTVEKELAAFWPESTIVIDEIARTGPARIVEEFRVAYRLWGNVEVEAETPSEAPPAAFREMRRRMTGSRYERTVWDGE